MDADTSGRRGACHLMPQNPVIKGLRKWTLHISVQTWNSWLHNSHRGDLSNREISGYHPETYCWISRIYVFESFSWALPEHSHVKEPGLGQYTWTLPEKPSPNAPGIWAGSSGMLHILAHVIVMATLWADSNIPVLQTRTLRGMSEKSSDLSKILK